MSDLHELFKAGQVDVVDALLRRGADVLLDVCPVHKRQVDLVRHVGGRQDHHVGVSSNEQRKSKEDGLYSFPMGQPKLTSDIKFKRCMQIYTKIGCRSSGSNNAARHRKLERSFVIVNIWLMIH